MNVKNAFDIDLDCIDNLSKLVTQTKSDTTWVRTGEALGAGAKIYGYLNFILVNPNLVFE